MTRAWATGNAWSWSKRLNVERPRIILDTSTIVSAILFPKSVPAAAVRQAFREGTVLTSYAAAQELEDVVTRAKFDRYQTPEIRVARVDALLATMSAIAPAERLQICRDPKDDKFLELALAAGADFLVTGDADLLALHPFHKTAILTPADYLAHRARTLGIEG